MPKFKITYIEPKSQLEKVVLTRFEDWTGYSVCSGILLDMEPITITAKDQAQDYVFYLCGHNLNNCTIEEVEDVCSGK